MDVPRYPPIADYGYISDCHASALVSRFGSIDWCCLPRIDSKSCFGRLLGWDNGGYCRIAPTEPYQSTRRYLPETLVLETSFRTETAEARLFDCFAMCQDNERHPRRQILRLLEGIRGTMAINFEVVPRFDYGAVKPWIRNLDNGRRNSYAAIGGSNGLLISGDPELDMHTRHALSGHSQIAEGERVRLSLIWRHPEDFDRNPVEAPSAEELDSRLDETVAWWREWTRQGRVDTHHAELVRRSAIVLKGLSQVTTGAIAAAATTSLPESPTGVRNWDYRYSWVRDSSFAVNSLAELGYVKEADDFRRFIERSAAGSAEELQILFGVGGERRLHEYSIDELEGYRGAHPVRIGNAAEAQLQLDVYGELLEMDWRWHQRGREPDDNYRQFMVELTEAAARHWREPDRGIWEMRGENRHFVQSKVMCWAALDRGIKLLHASNPDRVDGWRRERDAVRQAIEEYGYDGDRGVFIQAFGYPEEDASLLLLPIAGFIPFDDPRMVRTTNAIRESLEEDGLLRRYPVGNDALPGREGSFLACSFWLAECLARQRRFAEAHAVLDRVLATGNDLGLFSEQYDPRTGEMWGNFPQALTHLSLISAIVTLVEMETGEDRAGEIRY